MNRSVLIAIIVAIILVGAAGAALVLTNNNKTESKTYDIRIGYLQGDLHQLARVVASNDSINGGTNLFKQYGLNISSPNPGGYAAGGDVMTAFAAGLIDIGYLGGPPTILKSLNAGTDVIIVALVNSEGSSIIVQDNINNFTDLKGKVVATPGITSIQHLLFLTEAEKNGMNVKLVGASGDANTVYYTTVAPKDMKAALEANTVQAIVGWEPYGSDVLLSGNGKVLEWSGDVWPDHPCCVIAVKRSFAETNPEAVEAFLKAHIKANQLINSTLTAGSGSKYTELIDLASTFSGRNTSVVVSSLQHIVLDYKLPSNLKSYLENFTQSYIDLGQIAASKITDNGYTSISDYVDHLVQPKYLANATKSI
jgi:NitT/TauT family transport system substrate-binding protein